MTHGTFQVGGSREEAAGAKESAAESDVNETIGGSISPDDATVVLVDEEEIDRERKIAEGRFFIYEWEDGPCGPPSFKIVGRGEGSAVGEGGGIKYGEEDSERGHGK